MAASPPAARTVSARVPSRHALAVLAGALAVLAWALMTVGAFVRSTESGLGCPDWPICHGKLVAGGGHALTEEAHRWVASILVIGALALVGFAWARCRGERRVTRPLVAVLLLLAAQVALGAITVLLKNVSWTVVIHYGGAAALVASLVLVAVRLRWPSPAPVPRDGFSRLLLWFATLSYFLLLAGSTVANTDSHEACGEGFPLCNGTLAPGLNHHVVINLVHRVWAGAMLIFAFWVFARARRARAASIPIVRAAGAVAGLYLLQAAIGIVVVAVGEDTAFEVIHSSIGSLTWAAIALLVALERTIGGPSRASAPGSAPAAQAVRAPA
jgi:heme A synthase